MAPHIDCLGYRSAGLLALVAALPLAAQADGDSFQIEARGNVLLGDGVPANDILGAGIGGRFNLQNGWFVSGAIEAYDFDFERPIDTVGLRQDPNVKTIDATTTNTVLSAGIGRVNQFRNDKLSWFWDLGVGVGFPDVKNATGPLSTGGTFTVVTDAGTEIHLLSKLGASYHFSPQWALNLVARLEHHFIDYKISETSTGATAKISSQSPMGAHIGLSYSF